jgi:hypothetical protein
MQRWRLTAQKLRHARDLGADVDVDYTTNDWPDLVRAAAPGGVDLPWTRSAEPSWPAASTCWPRSDGRWPTARPAAS